MKKHIKRILSLALVVLVMAVLIIIFPAITYKKAINPTPLPSAYKKGVYHLHSNYSDGKGTVAEITAAAAELNLDFAILTDHGRPNRKAAQSTAYINGVLLVGGSEFSLHCGHLASVGFQIPNYIFPPEPQEAIDEVRKDNGVCFISHPFDDKIPWTEWDVEGFTGIEVLSAYSCARRVGIFKLMAFPLRYWLNSDFALTDTLYYPSQNIDKWNEINQKTNTGYYGIYALDAHAKLPVTHTIQLNFPTYKTMFRVLTIYVKTGLEKGISPKGDLPPDAHEAASTITAALRKGRFFNAIESIASANGFDAFLTTENGERLEMGSSTVETAGRLTVLLPFPFATDVTVKRNGRIFKQIADNKEPEQHFQLNQKGFYTIEVFVSGHTFNKLPWILSNPFFLGQASKSTEKAEDVKTIETKRVLDTTEGFFKVEKNSLSIGRIDYSIFPATEEKTADKTTIEVSDKLTGESKEEPVTGFHFRLVKEEGTANFWSALSARVPFDFSGFKGLCFEARSDQKRRFWVEFRTGAKENATWFRRSFLVEVQWKRFYIPFDDFRVIFGPSQKVDLADIKSLFFSINNANAYAGTEGNFALKNLALY